MARVVIAAALLMGVTAHDALPLPTGALAGGSGSPGLLRHPGPHHRAGPAPAPAPAGAEAGLPALDAGQGPVDALPLERLICSYPWPCDEALAVARCESRLDSTAVGAYGERGLFQVRPELWGPVPQDPAGQVAQAYAIWEEHGWKPWTCRPYAHELTQKEVNSPHGAPPSCPGQKTFNRKEVTGPPCGSRPGPGRRVLYIPLSLRTLLTQCFPSACRIRLPYVTSSLLAFVSRGRSLVRVIGQCHRLGLIGKVGGLGGARPAGRRRKWQGKREK